MERATHLRLTEQLRAELGTMPPHPPFAIPADRYRSEAWLARERALFAAPRIVASAASVAEPGACVPVDIPGTSAILVRGHDGVLRAFANACRHRATRLVDAPCNAKAMVCPYHGWTYELTGALRHIPHPEAFAGVARCDLVDGRGLPLAGSGAEGRRGLIDGRGLPLAGSGAEGRRGLIDGRGLPLAGSGAEGRRGLIDLPVAERHGLVWLRGEPQLGALAGDLAALGLADHVAYEQVRVTRRCNWKLVIEAFLDGYHIRVLHRDSIYRFFLDAASVAEPVGPHIRALTGRRALREAPADLSAVDLRLLGTPSYLIFPATVVIVHPDFVSVITMHPLTADTADYDHLMLIPASRAHETEHWAKSWALIEEGVFQREDLWVCEQIQRGIAAGSTDELVFGTLEFPVRWFHDAIEARLGEVP